MFNYDEWVSNHERIYNMSGSVWQDQKAFGRIAVEAALKLAEGQKPPTNSAITQLPQIVENVYISECAQRGL